MDRSEPTKAFVIEAISTSSIPTEVKGKGIVIECYWNSY